MPRHSWDNETFWQNIDCKGEDECWPWIAKTRSENGYGRLDIFGEKGIYAPRAAYYISHPGSIQLKAPKDRSVPEFIRHSCDNPACCNPKHLSLGTHDDNMKDKVSRGRQVKWNGAIGSPRAKLSADDVMCIRLQKASGIRMDALQLLYEVSRATIHGVVYGRHYQDVA